MEARPLITTEQVAVINRARRVLAEIAQDAYESNDSQASGMIYARAEVAREALFALLNWFNSYAGGELSTAQLHND
jgi:hypothetical protein